jgi:hypothetical protein
MNLIARDSLIGMVASPLVWAGHFLFCYVLVAVACAFGFATAAEGEWDAIRIVLVIVSALALGLIAVLTFLAYRRWRQTGGSERPRDQDQARHRFMAVAALLLGILSGIGVVYATVPLFMLSTCQ